VEAGDLLCIEILNDGGFPVVALRGELDLSNAQSLRDQLPTVRDAPLVAVDMTDLAFVDSTGLSVIAQYGKQLKDAQRELYFVITRPVIRRRAPRPDSPRLKLAAPGGRMPRRSRCETNEPHVVHNGRG